MGEVARVLLQLHSTCRAGDVSFAQQFLQACQGRVDLSKCQGVERTEYATEEDQLLDGLQSMEIETGEGIDEESDDSMDDCCDDGVTIEPQGLGKGAGQAGSIAAAPQMEAGY